MNIKEIIWEAMDWIHLGTHGRLWLTQ